MICASSIWSFSKTLIHKEYLEILEKEITKAFVYSYQEQAESLFQNYLDHAEAYVNQTSTRSKTAIPRKSSCRTKVFSNPLRSRLRLSARQRTAFAKR